MTVGVVARLPEEGVEDPGELSEHRRRRSTDAVGVLRGVGNLVPVEGALAGVS